MPSALRFGHLSVHRKVILILALIVLPVVGMMVLYLNTIRQSLAIQEEVDRLLEIQIQTQSILSMVVDVQDGFRGFVLVRNEKFLKPFYTAEEAVDPAINKLKQMVLDDRDQLQQVSQIEARVRALLQQKRQLIDAVRLGELKPVREHIESGEGQNALTAIREDLRIFENIDRKSVV